MTTKSDLDLLDRATLSAWRAWNTLAWSVAALAVAFATSTAFFWALPSITIHGSSRRGALEATLIMIGPTVLSAVAIAVVVGRHVIRRPLLTAGIVAIAHFVSSMWAVFHHIRLSSPAANYFIFTPSSGRVVVGRGLMLLVLVVEVYIAATIAARTWRKRPRALRAMS